MLAASSLLLVDWAVKGSALLLLAAVAAIVLRRDSAATRHLAWLLAIVALLFVPVLSAILPQWRVLPEWADMLSQSRQTSGNPLAISTVADGADALPQIVAGAQVGPENVELGKVKTRQTKAVSFTPPSATGHQAAAKPPASQPHPATAEVPLNAPELSWSGASALSIALFGALPIVWALGFVVLVLRLLAARWMLWNARRHATVIWSSNTQVKEKRASATGGDAIGTAASTVCLQLGIRRPITVLIHPEKTIPVVWGVFRCCLLLPAAARHWSSDQLRSVLLHELAHFKRRDTLAQLLTQIACALHWFNPLVWLAAWRLGVERERACDNLVLASGVRPSAYAVHLLDVVTGHSLARFTPACGLAMARQSSLEGRLTAVLAKNLNRRGVSVALASIALAIALGVAVPIAMLRAAEEKPAAPLEKQESQRARAGAAAKVPDDREIVFITRETKRPLPKLDAGDGVTLEINEHVFHGADVITTARVRYSAADGAITAHDVDIAMDAFGNRAKWALAWVRGTKTLWHVNGEFDGRYLRLYRTEFDNPKRIVTDYDANYPGEPVDGLDIPMGLRAKFEEHFDITNPKVMDKSGGLPEVSGRFIHVAQPVKAGGDVPGKPAPPSPPAKKWKVLFVDGASGQRVPAVRMRLCVRTVDGSQISNVTRVVHWNGSDSDMLEVSLHPNQYGEVLIQDDKLTGADEPTRYFGNVPADLPESRKHTDSETPFVVQVLPRTNQGAKPQPVERPRVAASDMKPKEGAKLKPGTEQKLEWGEPASGLRMALCWPPVMDEPAAGESPELHLAVQNVSKGPVRLCTTAEATQQRRLTHKSRGTIQFRIVDDKPAGIDSTLRPGETVFLRLFAPDEQGAARASAEIASGVRRMPDYSLVAEMDISKGPAGAWAGKLTTPDTRAGLGAEAPKHRAAQELFKAWLQHTRLNGKIPGGLVARLGERVKEFVKANATDKAGAPYAKRMAPLVSRFDDTRDRQPTEAAALLDEIADVSDAPLSLALEEIAAGKIQHGLRLEKDLENAPWGEPLENGLRTACIIGPGVVSRLHYVDWVGNVVSQGAGPADKASKGVLGTDIPLGTPLGCRILIHNAGKEPVVFRTRWWHHIEPTAKDAQGAEIGMESVTRFTRAPLVTWRLEPGRYIELLSPGFGLGKYGYHDFGSADIASWIGAKAGDELTLTPGPLPLFDWNESPAPSGEPRWWLDFITARLNLATPLPADAAERTALLRQAMADLFLQNVSPTEEEIAAFVKDISPQALANLAERIFHRPDVHAWAGPLQSGPTKFRVAAADPAGAKRAAEPAATPPPAAPAAPVENPKSDEAPSAQVLPKHEDALALYKSWSTAARADGKIPGGLIGMLGEGVKKFIEYNPTWKTTPQLKKMLSRFDASRDWSATDAVALLDEVAAVQATAISMALDREGEGIIGTGEPLPPHLASGPWGQPLPNGLRLVYRLEPRSLYQRLNTKLKGHILIHNSGQQPVVFRAWSWYQAGHKATDASGENINVFSLEWTTLGRLEPHRLAPGEFIEINTAGIGVGPKTNIEDWQNIRVGTWVEAKEGDEVTLTTDPIGFSDGNEKPGDEPQWWLDHIKARLSRHLPLPADARARRLIVSRVAMEFFGTPASDEITAAFVADTTPTALDSLARRLFQRPGQKAWAGSLVSGPTRFRVRPADPDAAKRPRLARDPGWYTLPNSVVLDVSRSRAGERIVNKATLLFYPAEANANAGPKQVPLKLPDGYYTWAAAMAPSTTVLWVAQKGLLQRIDFRKPENVAQTRFEADAIASAPIPADLREALGAALAVPDASKQAPESLPPAAPAAAAEAPKSVRSK
jgi:beta-lactamase regulating signal transducer with metallopeptidase domain